MTKEEAITIMSDIRSEYNCFSHIEGGRYHALSMGIEALKERKQARWKCISIGRYACSLCCFEPYYSHSISSLNFCPNCGADMRGET